MKVLILLACIFAGVTCGWIPQSLGYHGPQHVPIIKNGVPIETPEVQHAKAAHYAAILKAASSDPHYNQHNNYEHSQHNNHYEHSQPNNHYNHAVYSSPKYDHDVHSHTELVSYKKVPLAYETSHVIPSIGHDGKPLDTPEVEAAKAHHFQAFGKALAMTAPHSPEPEPHYRYRRSIFDILSHVIGHKGVPVEPLDVQQARQEHLEAHASAHHSTSNGYSIHQVHPQIYGHHDSYEIPHIGYHGVPLDTAEVAHAKEAHFAAHNEALSRISNDHGHVDYWNSNDLHY